jgi:hypothetical protein
MMGGDPIRPPEPVMRPVTLLLILVLLSSLMTLPAEDLTTDIAVYGGTPAGIAAALAAGRAGKRVLLIEPYSWVGGLVTNGLTHTDYHAYEGLTGTFLEFAKRVEAQYIERYGKDSPQVRACMRGTQAEPSVNRAVFEGMLTEVPTVRLLTRHELVRSDGPAQAAATATTLRTIRLSTGDGRRITVAAMVFIDASYEGDLMALAGESWRSGREGRAQYGESLAPAQADDQLQAYNFRLTFTDVADNRVAIPQPPGYRREDFTGILPLLEQGAVKAVFTGSSGRDTGIYKAQVPPLPNGKRDINDVSHSAVRLSMPGANHGWPDGDAATRRAIFAEHLRYNLGLLHFLQNDTAVPPRWRDEARRYGLCRDEFTTTGHLPEQLYVREARRLIGQHVYSEADTAQAEGDQRAVLHRDAIAMGEYSHNCHGTHHEGPLFGGRHTGEFYKATMPYQIPYGVIVPLKTSNLLVPVAVSSSHVGFCALRLEPIWMSLGQAAGHAAVIAIDEKTSVQRVAVDRLQRRLHADGSATIYTSDVLPGHPDFAAVQWWGTLGGLHGLEPRPADGKPTRGKNIAGQYFETYQFHAVGVERPLDAATAERWTAMARSVGVPSATVGGSTTRGEFIRRAFAAVR